MLSPTELFWGEPLFLNVAKISSGPVDDFIYYYIPTDLNGYIVSQGFELKN